LSASNPTPFVVLSPRSHFAIRAAQTLLFSTPPPRHVRGKSCAAFCPQLCCHAPSLAHLLSHLHGVEQERRVLVVKHYQVKLERLPEPALQVAHVINWLLTDVIGGKLLSQLSFGGLDGSRLVDGPGDGVAKLA